MPEPVCNFKTNGHLADCLIVTRAALKKANSDKATLSEWADGVIDSPAP